jgi:hypothetical protein
VSYSYADIEDRLKHSFQVFVSDVPDQPPVPWSTPVSTPSPSIHHWRNLVGVAASIVVIALALLLWASPSAGARYQGHDVFRSAPAVVVHHGLRSNS